jgi:hypothetical protein
MDDLIESIRSATTSGATDEARAAGANACRTILLALETPAGESMRAPTVSSALPAPRSSLEAAVSALRGVPPDQLLDLAIAKLRTMVPATPTEPVHKLSIPLVSVPRKP